MSGQSPQPQQLYLVFQTVQERRSDGSFVITPTRVVDDREVDAAEAERYLKPLPRRAIIRLAKIGEIEGWQMPTDRGNGKWRFRLSSLLAFKPRMVARSRGELWD